MSGSRAGDITLLTLLSLVSVVLFAYALEVRDVRFIFAALPSLYMGLLISEKLAYEYYEVPIRKLTK